MNAEPRIAVVGMSGRMGREILQMAKDSGLKVTAGVSPTGQAPESGTESGIVVAKTVGGLNPQLFDVVIDFSLPEVTKDVVAWCVKEKKPLVSGVTGLGADEKKSLTTAGASIPVLWSPNMSLGIAVMSRMLAQFSALKGFDFQIEELHHIRKKDRPSGTAILLQDKLKAAVSPQEVPDPLAIRGGGIFGIHKVWAMSEEETITLEHTAMNRRVFARGALKSAVWIFGKAPGVYTLDHVVGA